MIDSGASVVSPLFSTEEGVVAPSSGVAVVASSLLSDESVVSPAVVAAAVVVGAAVVCIASCTRISVSAISETSKMPICFSRDDEHVHVTSLAAAEVVQPTVDHSEPVHW